MRFMMLMIPRVYQPNAPAGEKAGEGFAPDAEIVAQMTKYNEDLAKAGALIALDGLQPSSKGARISFTGGKRIVTDGPFIDTKEEAIEWAKRCPAGDGDVIEVRQVFEMSDFPADVQRAADNPTVRAQVDR